LTALLGNTSSDLSPAKNWVDDNFSLLSNGDDCSRVADPSVSNFVLGAVELWITIEWKFPFNLVQI